MTELEYKKMIYEKASKVKTKKELNALIDEICKYKHDYGTIVYGCAAAMNAAFKVVNSSDMGGITGFHAGCLGWELVHEYMMVRPPCKIVQYEHMLFPQYESKFEKVIDPETHKFLINKAKESLEKDNEHASKAVLAHWEYVANGGIPFGYVVKE